MKNSTLPGILTAVLILFASVSFVMGQTIQSKNTAPAQGSQADYNQLKSTTPATPQSAIKYNQVKPASPAGVQANRPVANTNMAVSGNALNPRYVQQLEERARLITLRDQAAARGLPTAKYDAALEALNNSINNQPK